MQASCGAVPTVGAMGCFLASIPVWFVLHCVCTTWHLHAGGGDPSQWKEYCRICDSRTTVSQVLMPYVFRYECGNVGVGKGGIGEAWDR